MKRLLAGGAAVALAMGLPCAAGAWAGEGDGTTKPEAGTAAARSRGQAAIEAAVRNGKHLFIFFFKPDNERARNLRPLFDETMQELADEADAIAIDVTDPLEKELVERYRADRVVLSMVSLSPSGQIAHAFVGMFQKEDLKNAFVTPAEERCRKHFQEGRAVLLSAQAGSKEDRDRALAGVNAFKADPGYGHLVDAVELAADDPKEVRLLRKLEIDPKTGQTVTLLLFPPFRIMGRFVGATQKSALAKAMLAALNAGCECGR